MIKNITINSYTIGDGTDVTILDARGFGSPRVDNAIYPNSGRHGSQLPNSYWRERNMIIELGLRSSSVANYATLRNNVLKAFGLPRTGNALMQFSTLDGKDLQMYVQLRNEIDAPFEKGRISSGIMRLELVSPDSYMNSQTLNESTVGLPVAGGTEIPTEIPLSLTSSGGVVTITNTGNGMYKPRIIIDGPIENPTILNATTGEQFTITGTFLSVDQIVIDCDAETVTKNGVLNILEDFSGDFISLGLGTNQINFSASTYEADALATIQWRLSYLSI